MGDCYNYLLKVSLGRKVYDIIHCVTQGRTELCLGSIFKLWKEHICLAHAFANFLLTTFRCILIFTHLQLKLEMLANSETQFKSKAYFQIFLHICVASCSRLNGNGYVSITKTNFLTSHSDNININTYKNCLLK